MQVASHTPIQLIVGLGNPGPRYSGTRHNAGAWLLEQLAQQLGVSLRPENKFKADIGKTIINGHDCWLARPTTYMNESGQAIGAITKFYKIPPEAVLVVHDELDFPPGVIKIKQEGGHGGHNGLRDTINHLSSKNFHRMRIGIGHPGNASEVHDYVLRPPRQHEMQQIEDAIYEGLRVLPEYVGGDQQKAIRELHNIQSDEVQ